MGLSQSRRAAALSNSVLVFTLWACDPSGSRAQQASPPPPPTKPSAPTPALPLARAVSRALEAGGGDQGKPQAPRTRDGDDKDDKDDKPVEQSRFVLDGLNDVGPAAPAGAFAHGVVMITRGDELAISKLAAPPSKSKKAAPGAIGATERSPDQFWPAARGPAVSATHAYWVSKGRLVRRALAGGELEVLATDARDGTRVAVASAPEAVAYITRPAAKQDSVAKLRLPDGRKLDLTPEGAAASSVSLVRVGGDLLISSIDGRSGMTPVHARRFRVKAGELDPDVVVWVAGATQGMTEIVSVGWDGGGWLLLPVERDVSHFGLVALSLGTEPRMDPPLRWRTYENGLDRSPVAGAVLCGAPTAVYVRPADARPMAKQELVVSELTLAEVASSEVLASARGFADVSLYPVPEGALLAYVADRRTWARLIRCK